MGRKEGGNRGERKTKEMKTEQYEEIEGCQSPSPWSPAPAQTPDAPQFEPPAVVPGQKGIDELDYYHGEDVNAMLHNDGEFLVRNTELVQGTAVRQMCLSVKALGTVRHFPLQANEVGLYTIDGQPQFPTMLALINHYYTTRAAFTKNKVRLLSPVVRHDWELLHHQVQLRRKIGEGAFGAVFAGLLSIKPTDKPRPVAVKTMKCSYQTKAKIEELMKEARLMRELDHPHIVRCFGVAAEIEPLYIVFEMIAGGGLDSYLKQNTVNVVVEDRLQMVWHASLALEYVHSKGIIHCDIACRNCLYGDGELKLSDFGMSRKTERHELATNDLTPVRWTAPEVFVARFLTPASDVWAMGVLVWEIFNNAREPFEGMTGQEVRDQVVKNQFRLPKLPDWAPEEMDALLDEMFTFDPKNRIRMPEIAEKMEQICQMYPPALTPASKASSRNKQQAPSSGSSSRRSRSSCGRRTGTVGSNAGNKHSPIARRSGAGTHTAGGSGSRKARPSRNSKSNTKKGGKRK